MLVPQNTRPCASERKQLEEKLSPAVLELDSDCHQTSLVKAFLRDPGTAAEAVCQRRRNVWVACDLQDFRDTFLQLVGAL